MCVRVSVCVSVRVYVCVHVSVCLCICVFVCMSVSKTLTEVQCVSVHSNNLDSGSSVEEVSNSGGT